MNDFNDMVLEMYKNETEIERVRLYDCEISLQVNNFIPFQKVSLNNNSPKEWIFEEVISNGIKLSCH